MCGIATKQTPHRYFSVLLQAGVSPSGTFCSAAVWARHILQFRQVGPFTLSTRRCPRTWRHNRESCHCFFDRVQCSVVLTTRGDAVQHLLTHANAAFTGVVYLKVEASAASSQRLARRTRLQTRVPPGTVCAGTKDSATGSAAAKTWTTAGARAGSVVGANVVFGAQEPVPHKLHRRARCD